MLGLVLSVAYLANLGAGVIEFIPDNLPIVGNLDEIVATLILFVSLRKLGLNPTLVEKKDKASKSSQGLAPRRHPTRVKTIPD